MPLPTINDFNRASNLLDKQSKSSVAITGGSISSVSSSTNIYSNRIITVPNDFSVTSNTTLADITGFSTSVAVGTYKINAFFGGTSVSSGGWKLSPSFSGTGTFSTSVSAYAGATVLLCQAGSSIADSNAILAGVIEGIFTVTVAGTLKYQFAQNASNVTASTISKGSYVELIRIA